MTEELGENFRPLSELESLQETVRGLGLFSINEQGAENIGGRIVIIYKATVFPNSLRDKIAEELGNEPGVVQWDDIKGRDEIAKYRGHNPHNALVNAVSGYLSGRIED